MIVDAELDYHSKYGIASTVGSYYAYYDSREGRPSPKSKIS
jgi:hypothetical protein